MSDRVLQKLVDELVTYKAPVGRSEEVNESRKSQGGPVGKIPFVNGETLFGFMAKIQEMV